MANVIKHKRGSGSDPGASDLVVGEVAIRTDVGKLFTKMDNGSVAEIAGGGSDIAINTLSSSSGTGGNVSGVFDGSAYRFTLSQPPSVSAYQLLVSINGVIQKPVAGTGQPSEGFAVDGTDIILGDAPATGADFFILTFKSLGVSEPADNSVTSAKIVDGAIVNADINASAAIAKSKIETFVTNNADNRVITGSGTANTLNGESNLTYDGSNLQFNTTANGNAVKLVATGNHYNKLSFDSNASSAGGSLAFIDFSWDGDKVADILAVAGSDTTNKDDGHLSFRTSPSQGAIAERLRITSDGKIGIGTTSPSAGLHVDAASGVDGPIFDSGGTGNTNHALLVRDSGNNQLLRVNNNGKVGIGTTSPVSILHLHEAGASGSPIIQFSNGDTGATSGDGFAIGLADNESPFIYNRENTDLRIGTNNTERMRIDSSGNVGIGIASPSQLLSLKAASGQCQQSLTSATDQSCAIYFGDTSSVNRSVILHNNSDDSLAFNTAATERMRIDSSGRLLLGTTTEGGVNADDLTIANSGHTGITIRSGTSNVGSLYFSDGTSGDDEYRGAVQYNHTDNFLRFYSDATERMRIASDGKISIDRTHASATTGNHPALDIDTHANGTAGATFATGIDFRIAGVHKKRLAITNADSSAGTGDWVFYRDNGGNECMRLTSDGNIAFNRPNATVGDNQSGNSTATPKRFVFNNDHSSGYTDASLKLYLFNGGTTRHGFTSGPNHDLQYHASGSATESKHTFFTQNTERMRIDASGNLLIGTTTEGEATGDDLTIANSGDCGITIRSGTSSKAKLLFSDGTSGDAEYRGNIQYDHNGDYMKFSTAASEHLRINSSGHALFGTTTDSVYDDNSGNGVVIRGANGAVDIKRNNDLLLNLNRVGGDGGLIRMIRDGATKADIGITSSHLTVDVNGSERLRVMTSGRILINRTNEDGGGVINLALNSSGHGISTRTGSTSTQTHHDFGNPNGVVGSIQTNGSSTSFNTSSDYRLKENASAISDGITRLKTLKPYRFNFKADASKTVDGFFAHEVTTVPEAITGTKDEVDSDNNPVYQGIDQSKLVPLLTAALQEAVGKIETLETKVAALEAS